MASARCPSPGLPAYAGLGPAAEVQVTLVTSGGRAKIELLVQGAAPLDLGAVEPDAWACVEIAHDGAAVSGALGAVMKGSRPLAVPVDAAEITFDWRYGANGNAGAGYTIDDVVLAPARIGCLH